MHRGGHHAEIRKRGITSADAGQAEEDVAEVIGFGDLLHLRAGIGDGDETVAGFVCADVCFTRSKKYCLKIFGSSVLPDLLDTMKMVLCEIDLGFEAL